MRNHLIVTGVFCLALAGASRVQAYPVFQNNESGSGLLRMANHNDQSVDGASIVLDSNGYFQLTVQGSSPQSFGGYWHNSAPGVYDLQVGHGFGPYGATGSGRLIATGGVLRQFEVGGASGNSPFYLSFGAGGYSCPQPASDGFALSFNLGGSGSYFYGQPHYANYGHYRGGHGSSVGISVQNNTYVSNHYTNNHYTTYQGNVGRGSFNAAARTRTVNRGTPARSSQPRVQQASHTQRAASHSPRVTPARNSSHARPAAHVQQVNHVEARSGGEHIKKQ